MRRTPTLAAGVVMLAGIAAPAAAQPLLPLDPAGLDLPVPRSAGAPRDASGDLYGAAITIHSASTHTFLDSAPDVHIFGGTTYVGLNTLGTVRAMHVTTTQTQVSPNTVEYAVAWAMDDAGAMIPAGTLLGVEPITGIGFHIGEGSAPAQLIEWHGAPGFTIVSATFELFDLGGTDLLGGAGVLNVNDHGGTGLSGSAFFGAADLSQLGLSVAVATISVQDVPAPGGVALLGAAGATALRRRRRAQ